MIDGHAQSLFDVTITRLRTNQVFVTGEVVQPSAYQLSSVATVLNALYAAGGPTEDANFHNIHVRRGNEISVRFDLYDYLLSLLVRANIEASTFDIDEAAGIVNDLTEAWRTAYLSLTPEATPA